MGCSNKALVQGHCPLPRGTYSTLQDHEDKPGMTLCRIYMYSKRREREVEAMGVGRGVGRLGVGGRGGLNWEGGSGWG